jgi:hypothetical protein
MFPIACDSDALLRPIITTGCPAPAKTSAIACLMIPLPMTATAALSFGVAMMAAPFATGDRTETDQLRHVLWRRSLPGRFSAQANR